MLTAGQMAAVRRFEDQYGPSEACFSPDRGSDVQAADPRVIGGVRAQVEKTIRVNLVYKTLASGDVVIAHADDTE